MQLCTELAVTLQPETKKPRLQIFNRALRTLRTLPSHLGKCKIIQITQTAEEKRNSYNYKFSATLRRHQGRSTSTIYSGLFPKCVFPKCIFPKCIPLEFFFQKVFFKSVFFQSVFIQSVFIKSVFIQSVFFRNVPNLRVF